MRGRIIALRDSDGLTRSLNRELVDVVREIAPDTTGLRGLAALGALSSFVVRHGDLTLTVSEDELTLCDGECDGCAVCD